MVRAGGRRVSCLGASIIALLWANSGASCQSIKFAGAANNRHSSGQVSKQVAARRCVNSREIAAARQFEHISVCCHSSSWLAREHPRGLVAAIEFSEWAWRQCGKIRARALIRRRRAHVGRRPARPANNYNNYKSKSCACARGHVAAAAPKLIDHLSSRPRANGGENAPSESSTGRARGRARKEKGKRKKWARARAAARR